MSIKKILLALLVMGVAAAAAGAQADYAARQRVFSISAGAFASGFRTDYATGYPLFGPGAFVDVRLTHWIQAEAEGRWLRFNEFAGESQDNYLIGPRVPIKKLWKFDTFGKALIGVTRMRYPQDDPSGLARGQYTDIALGGTAEYKLNRRFTLRALDLEYQFMPDWPAFPCKPNTAGCAIPYPSPINWGRALQPYGVSIGLSYRIF